MQAERLADGVELWQGDCLEVMRSMPGGVFDLVITSPPYNLGTTAGGGFADVRKYPGMKMGKWSGASKNGGIAYGYDTHHDSLPHEEYVAWQKDCLLEMWRLIGDSGAIFYNHKPRHFGGRLVTPFEYNPGLPVRQVVIWARAGGINFAPTHYVPTHEWIVVFAKDGFRLKNKGASGVGDVWNIPQQSDPEHPAPFPLAIPRRIIETTGARSVLDPFAGSGTTLRAAMLERCEATGIELSPRYCDIIRRRVQAADCRTPGTLFAETA